MAVPKLDKDHGFVKFIVNNQLDRDKFEKEQKSNNQKGEKQQGNKKVREERKTYVPPSRVNGTRGLSAKDTGKSTPKAQTKNASQSDSNISIKDDKNLLNQHSLKDPKLLFEIEYIPKHCCPVYAKVYQDSSPKEVVLEISEKSYLTDALKNALYFRILKEIQGEQV